MRISDELQYLNEHLPLANSDFGKLRKDQLIYVDKTAYIEKFVRNSSRKNIFLSRPRRFGKSLLLNTIEELFKGNEEAFRGLHIHDKWDWENKFPVIHLDLSDVSSHSVTGIEKALLSLMKEVFESTHKIPIDKNLEPKQIFKDSLLAMYEREKRPLVILIDEYDIPILSTITNNEECEKTKRIMHDFYQIIKKMEKYIQFTMLTGISKFGGVSVFSALNNLVDISLIPDYSAICGYTEAELDKHFAPFMEMVDRDRFREMYNGYNWLGESVYNPLEVMKAIDLAVSRKRIEYFKSFWFKTGTPDFLANIMKKRGILLPNLGPDGMLEDVFSELKIDHLSPEGLLFQTGYLTIGEEITDEDGYGVKYRLKYPNREVRLAISDYFLQNVLVSEEGTPMDYPRDNLNNALAKADIRGLLRTIHQFFASLSHEWYRNNSIASSEGFYSTIIFTMLASVCNRLEPESQTNKGQIDLFASKGNKRYVIEVKVRENAHGASGLEQIIRKGYAQKYQDDGDLYLVGMEFSSEQRNIVKMEYCVGINGERIELTPDDIDDD